MKEASFPAAREKICQIIKMVFGTCRFLLEGDLWGEEEKEDFRKIFADPGDSAIALSSMTKSLQNMRMS